MLVNHLLQKRFLESLNSSSLKYTWIFEGHIKVVAISFFLFAFVNSCTLFPQQISSTFPVNNATEINPDIQLKLTFSEKPILNNSGEIRIYDAQNDSLVDLLDLSIPPGPKNNRAPAPYDSMIYASVPDVLYTVRAPDTSSTHVYQKNYIGGHSEADAYHFYPVLIHENTATICLHNNRLGYNKTYYVKIDPQTFSLNSGIFQGITEKKGWTFTTKKNPPSLDSDWLVVSADGTGDFNTVQGAIDFIPENNPERKTIFIKNGRYEEIVYFRNKENVTFLGEDQEKVLICYANNGVFNNKIMSPDPALAHGYHNLRTVFALNSSSGIRLANFTIRSLGEKPAQAEALLLKGEKIIVNHVNIEGSGDALQATGTIYISDSKIQGFGDNVLGYGAVFFKNCDFVSTYGPHMWIRNSDANHGNVCVNCTFRTIGDVFTTIARTNDNHGDGYPYCESVIIDCALEGIKPEGWSAKGKGITHIHYWEHNSINLSDGKPVDVSQRSSITRQLTMEKDSAIINNYKNPTYVLGGWTPSMAPLILTQPVSKKVEKGETAMIGVEVAAVPEATYQWLKDGKPIKGATRTTLKIEHANINDTGTYTVAINNNAGNFISGKAVLTIK